MESRDGPPALAWSAGVSLCPGARAMALASDKAAQRSLAAEVGLRLGSHRCTVNDQGLRDAVGELGYPAVVKATRGDYDGRAVWWLHGPTDLDMLIGERVTGTVAGKSGTAAVTPFVVDLGVLAGEHMAAVRKAGRFLVGFALIVPLVLGGWC